MRALALVHVRVGESEAVGDGWPLLVTCLVFAYNGLTHVLAPARVF